VSMSRELANATAEQEHLRAIEQRFSAVFRNAAVGIGLLRPGKTFITANAAMCGMLGRTAREMPGLRLEECVHPQDDAKLNRVFDAIVRGETDAYRAEHRYLQPGNQPYWGDMSFAPVLSPGGAVTAMLWIIVGITERKRTAQALQRLNEELEEQVAQRTTELKDANVKLSRSLDKLREDEEAGRMIQFNLLPEERRRIGREIVGRINAVTGYGLTDAFCGFKMYRVAALAKLHLTEHGYGMPIELWMQAWKAGLNVTEKPIVLKYLDSQRTFGGELDDAETRRRYYHAIIDRELAAGRA